MRASRVGDTVSRFHSRYEIDQATGCWNWTGRLNHSGYGIIAGEIKGKRYVPAGVNMMAHRVSWIIHNGEIPKSDLPHGTVVRHKCDNPKCVNPAHLLLGTQADNVRDMIARGRRVVTVKHGADHWNSSLTHEQIRYVCSFEGKTKALAAELGVGEDTIKRVRARNGLGAKDPDQFHHKKPSQAIIDHIRSTPKGTRGLTKIYGMSKTAISNIRKGKTYS